MIPSLDRLRRQAKRLKSDYDLGHFTARQRLELHPPRPRGAPLKHADFLHVIALENSFESWPKLKFAAETIGLDRAAKQQRLKVAIFHGQNWVVDRLLQDTPDLAKGSFGLEVALYDLEAVQAALWNDPNLATKTFGPRRPILHLAFSRTIHAHPEKEADMLAIAQLLVKAGADVNDGFSMAQGDDHPLSALYGAVGHADNMVLAEWLLENGANPNDGESLYHSTELGHHRGLRLLLAHGARPEGTNALPRALDFDDAVAVALLLEHGSDPNEFFAEPVGGEAPWVIPSLHQAARRLCSPEVCALLLDAGADPSAKWQGVSAYAYACIYGNHALAETIEARGGQTELSDVEAKLARAARGQSGGDGFIDPETLHPEMRLLIRQVLHLPGKMAHVQALVALGLEFDRPDESGLTPIQVAGWEGLPDMLGYFLRLGTDLSHVNNFGGTLLSTIVHGSENAPDRETRDHIGCARLVLEHGVALPERVVDLAGEEEMAAFLADWAERYPGQVAEGAIG